MRSVEIKNRTEAPILHRGSVLLVVVILILLLSLTSLTALQIGRDSRLRSIKTDADIAARYAADAGVAQTLYLMNQALQAGTWTAESVPTFNRQQLTGDNAEYSVTVNGSFESGYAVTSQGNSKQISRTVRAILKTATPFSLNYAVLSQNNVALKGKATVKGFNSSDLSQTNLTGDIGTLSDKENSINIKNGAVVYGDVYVGPGGDPLQVVSVQDRSDIKGELFNQPVPPPLQPVIAPIMKSIHGRLNGKEITLTAKDSGVYTDIDVASGGYLRVEEDCVLVVTGDITLKSGVSVQIPVGGSLTIYLNGDLNAGNASGITNETCLPSNFKVYGTGTEQKINLKNSGDLYGVIYAPNANMVLDNGANAYGSFIVNNFELKNSGNVFYDAALKEVELADEVMMFVIVRWEEL